MKYFFSIRVVYFVVFVVVGINGLQAQTRVALPPVGDKLLYRFGDSSAVIGTKEPDSLKGVLFGMITDTGRTTSGSYNFGALLLPRLDSSRIRRHLGHNTMATEGSVLYDRNNKGIRFYDGISWQILSVGEGNIYNKDDSIQKTNNDRRVVTMKGKSLLFTLDTVAAVEGTPVKYSFFGIGTDTARYALDVSTASFARNKKGTWSANTGSDSVAVRINHVVEEDKTTYGLVLDEESNKPMGRSAVGFHFGASNPYMKGNIWTRSGSGFTNTSLGIDVADSGKVLRNRILMDTASTNIYSGRFSRSRIQRGDTALIITHIGDNYDPLGVSGLGGNSTDIYNYGLLLRGKSETPSSEIKYMSTGIGFQSLQEGGGVFTGATLGLSTMRVPSVSTILPYFVITLNSSTTAPGRLERRVFIDQSSITLQMPSLSSGSVSGVDTAVRIIHKVSDGQISYGLWLQESSNQATGRSAMGFYNGNQNYMKTAMWTQVGATFSNTAFGIDVASPSRALQNRLLIDRHSITFSSYPYMENTTKAGNDTAVTIRHTVQDGQTGYGLILKEGANQATGKSAIGFYNGNSSYMKGNIWTQVGSGSNNTTFGIDVADESRNLRNRLHIHNDGYIGIGTTNPTQAGYVHIIHSYNSHFPVARRYTTVTDWTGAHWPLNVGLYVVRDIYTEEGSLALVSDIRLKNIIGDLTPVSAISDIEKIRLVRYRFKDTLRFSREYRGVIAQELEKVMPAAVGNILTYIPSIYKYADNVKTLGTTTSIAVTEHQLVKGDKVKIFVLLDSTDYPIETEVVAVGSGSFTIPNVDSLLRKIVTYADGKNPPVTKVFVFGKQVQDGKAVDYNQIMVTNVAATQALLQQNKTKESYIQNLERDNKALKKDMQQLGENVINENKALKARMQQLEEALRQVIAAPKGATQSVL